VSLVLVHRVSHVLSCMSCMFFSKVFFCCFFPCKHEAAFPLIFLYRIWFPLVVVFRCLVVVFDAVIVVVDAVIVVVVVANNRVRV